MILLEEFQTAVGQLEFIGNTCAFKPWFPAALPLQAHTRSLRGILLRSRWAKTRPLPECCGTGSGPMRGFCLRNFRLLWANSSSSTRPAHLTHGSRQHSAAGPRESLATQPVALPVGQNEAIA